VIGIIAGAIGALIIWGLGIVIFLKKPPHSHTSNSEKQNTKSKDTI
jgi:hypothetical protein